MSELKTSLAALRSDAPQLAIILDRTDTAEQCWTPDDLPDLLRHQWAAPIDFDLATVECDKPNDVLTSAVKSQIHTFGDLLRHPSPPLALLKLAKDFFKDKAGKSAKRHPEQEIAYVFYLLVIMAAAVRLHSTISSLSEMDLRSGLAWSLGQPWLQGEPREILGQLAAPLQRIS